MTDFLPAPHLRALADEYRTADSALRARSAADQMAAALTSLPETARYLFTDATHFAHARGWGVRATAAERAQAHIRLMYAGIGEAEPAFGSVEMREAATDFIPELLADLWQLAEDYGLDREALLAAGQLLLDEYR
jgi:hypothetical protein